jgi:hypothetical protein
VHRKAKNDRWLTGGLLRLVCLGNSLCVGITIMSKSGIIEIIKPVNPLREREGTRTEAPQTGCEVTEAFTIAKNACSPTAAPNRAVPLHVEKSLLEKRSIFAVLFARACIMYPPADSSFHIRGALCACMLCDGETRSTRCVIPVKTEGLLTFATVGK